LVLFKNGQPIDRIEGVLRAEQLVERLRSGLG
jgi:thioredoxin-like negative regulator of GroEL